MHGMLSGMFSVAQGQDFESDFLSAGFADIAGDDSSRNVDPVELAKDAVNGGIGSVLGGGKFANGAMTGCIAEDVELFTTIAVNVAIIFAAIPLGIGYLRRVPWQSVQRVAIVFAGIGLTLSAAAAIAWFILAPEPPRYQCGKPLNPMQLKGMSDDEIIIRGYSSTEGGCIGLGGR